jgi:hypothetical protein
MDFAATIKMDSGEGDDAVIFTQEIEAIASVDTGGKYVLSSAFAGCGMGINTYPGGRAASNLDQGVYE